jgi:hypothetical protein
VGGKCLGNIGCLRKRTSGERDIWGKDIWEKGCLEERTFGERTSDVNDVWERTSVVKVLEN